MAWRCAQTQVRYTDACRLSHCQQFDSTDAKRAPLLPSTRPKKVCCCAGAEMYVMAALEPERASLQVADRFSASVLGRFSPLRLSVFYRPLLSVCSRRLLTVSRCRSSTSTTHAASTATAGTTASLPTISGWRRRSRDTSRPCRPSATFTRSTFAYVHGRN